MMVTVAKTLDVPIKLVFPRPAPPGSPKALPSLAMLGLGDVVLPGIMIGLALRFDLFLFYLRQQKQVPGEAQEDGTLGSATIVKPKYISLSGRWSDYFWTHSLTGRPLFGTSTESKRESPFTFPKTYFKASLVGYVAGMLATLGVMHIWGHAQPALLYLVPGVLGSLWLTALFRGEIGLMWEFSEAVEDDGEKKDGDKTDADKKTANTRSSFFSLSEKKSEEREARMKKAMSKHVTVDESSDGDGVADKQGSKKGKVEGAAKHRSEREFFSFSVEAPWSLKKSKSTRKESQAEETESPTEKEKPNWAPTETEEKDDDAVRKRVRLS
jgi:minor histocompatibility antigen H13